MPYTPPSQQSPASSRNSTPAISRNSSYSQDIHTLSPSHSRPTLPKSVSSTTYLNKHRRSPSATLPSNQDTSATYKFNSTGSKDAESTAFNGSLRKSPPPMNDLAIPPGAIMSPPDSSENSDGDEANARTGRRREVENTWNELQQAVRSMSIKRDPSPAKSNANNNILASEPTTLVASPTELSPEARKISHSRSSTENNVPHLSTACSEQTSGSEDSDDELRLHGKPSLVRKKSGELVKPALRASSRRRYSSMPGTPTYHKSVHFNDDGNQTRHFLQVDKPSAVSAGSSPVETYGSDSEFPFEGSSSSRAEWDIKLANFPAEDNHQRKSGPIWVERLYLSADNKSLVGQVAVANISFHKSVVARFTLDYWKTTSEVSAEYSDDVRKQGQPDGYDRFNFTIRLADQANLETKTLLLCIRYNVIGQEHWDNNNDSNYQIDFLKKVCTSRPTLNAYTSPLGARPLNAIPRSRHSPGTSRGRPRAPSIDDDMTSQLDNSYHFGGSDDLSGDESRATIKLKPKSKRGALFPNVTQPGQGLGGRYDFGASLSAALSNAQDKLGKQSGLMAKKASFSEPQGYFTQESKAAEPVPKKAPESVPQRPEALTVDRPAMGSAQYKDLVSKFCYFTPPGTKLSPQVPLKKAPTSTDGSVDHHDYFQSGDKSPSPKRSMSPQLDGSNDHARFSPAVSPFSSRAASPGRPNKAGHSSRGLSPARFGYPYHHERDGFLTNSPTPTAIQG